MIFFIVPCYNEEENINSFLIGIRRQLERQGEDYKVILINDGSTDNTLGCIKNHQGDMPIEVLSHFPNRGAGYVFNTGFQRALAEAGEADIFFTMEADNTSDIKIFPQMLEKIRDGYDLVLASCYAGEGSVIGTTLPRLVLSRTANFILRIFFKIPAVNTFSSFYRAYNARIIKEASAFYSGHLIEENGFVCMVELLLKLNALGAEITEVPMVLKCRCLGKSKMKILKNICDYARVFIKFLWEKKRCMAARKT